MDKDTLVQITRQDKIGEEDFRQIVDRMFEHVWGNLFPPQILTHDLSNTVSGNLITSSTEPIPDCETCGACCGSLICVDVPPEAEIDAKDCWEVTKTSDSGGLVVDRYIKRKPTDFSCLELDGTIGEKVSCRVYENRPPMCRQFEAGSDRCHAVRRAYGIEPYLSLDEMSEALRSLENAGERAGKK